MFIDLGKTESFIKEENGDLILKPLKNDIGTY